MFTIIISEKGGAERRETFDKNEINVGRVQGNDLMLPKGNVSKHHARLLYRDGRFIVTDLKSTNGTYVNGRKIAQATIVREGDKIYIGDFVLKLDTGASSSQNPPEQEPYRAPQMSPQPPAVQASPVHMAGGGPMTAAMPQMPPMAQPPPMGAMPPQMPPLPQPIVQPPPVQGNMMGARGDAAQHYALDREPDDSDNQQPVAQPAPAPVPKVPPAPRMPNVPNPNARVGNSTAVLQNRPQPVPPAPQPPAAAPPAAAPAPRATASPSIPPRQMPRETPQQAGRRLALITLVDRVNDVVELSALKKTPTVDEALTQQIDRAVREQAKAMRDEGEAPEGTDLELLVRDALREFVGLGPIGPLLEDDDVTEIHAMRHDYVMAVRGGVPVLADASFTSEEALYRVLTRLAHQSGEPWKEGEVVVERRLARGAQLVAITPPAASGCVLSIRKRRRVDMSLEELVRSGAMSRPMATFVDHCLGARANVLVVGAGSALASVLAALASGGPGGDRVAVLHDADDIGVAQAHAVSLALPDHKERGEEAVRAAAALRADRVVIGSVAGHVIGAALDAVADGAEGVIAGAAAPSLRHALARLAAQVALTRPGVGADAARESIAESFDVAIEVTRLQDGRLRITRIAELAGTDGKSVTTRDLFTHSGDGAGEGAFVASGVVPRIANEFAARGIRVDQGMFKRTVGRN